MNQGKILLVDAMGVMFCDRFDHKKFMPYFIENSSIGRNEDGEEKIYREYLRLTRGELNSQEFFQGIGISNPSLDFLLEVKLDPDFLGFVDEIRELGFRLRVLSNDSQEWANYRNLCLGLNGVTRYYLTSSLFGVRKPERKIYEKVCWILGAEPHDFIYVDDIPDNLVEPKDMGMGVVHFSRDDTIKNEFPRAKNFSELYNYLGGNFNGRNSQR